jgi:TRAP-type C4-dicarboxylate transport system permease small subunit
MLQSNPILNTIESVFDALDRLLWVLVSVMIAGITVLVVINVILRYVFGASLFWVQTTATYVVIWASLLVVGPLFRKDDHLTIQFLFRRIPHRYRRIARTIQLFGITVFGTLVTYHGWEYTSGLGKTTSDPALGLQMFWFYAAIPACGLLISLYSAEKGFRVLVNPDEIDADYERQFGNQQEEKTK